jgi:putative mRNA 3-end processing factor
VTHGEEDALVHWATSQGFAARPLRLIGYGEEEVEPSEPANPSDQADAAFI